MDLSTYKFSSGYVMLEFIIIMPIFILLISIIVKFSDMFWKKLTLTHAVYSAVQECSRAGTFAANKLFEVNYNHLKIGQKATVTKSCEESNINGINLVTFSAVDTYKLNIPFFPANQSIILSESASMGKE